MTTFRILILSLVASSAFAQTKEPRFDVVSVKLLGPFGAPMPGVGDIVHPGGEFRDPGTTLKALIAEAYNVRNQELAVIGLPKWAEANVYSVVAKAGPEYAITNVAENRQAVLAMLRSLLADRFKLKLHQEVRTGKVMTIQAKKGGAKLQPVPAPVPPEKEGLVSSVFSDRRGAISGKKVTIASVAEILALWLKQPVVDQTGLTGFYDLNGKWEAPTRPGEPLPANTLGPEGTAQLISYFDQELGLTLKPDTASFTYWVVDSVEMPGEN
jgi:uncharacterized protein (TIGR03435 family)